MTPKTAPSVIEIISNADRIITIGITRIDIHQNLSYLKCKSSSSITIKSELDLSRSTLSLGIRINNVSENFNLICATFSLSNSVCLFIAKTNEDNFLLKLN